MSWQRVVGVCLLLGAVALLAAGLIELVTPLLPGPLQRVVTAFIALLFAALVGLSAKRWIEGK